MSRMQWFALFMIVIVLSSSVHGQSTTTNMSRVSTSIRAFTDGSGGVPTTVNVPNPSVTCTFRYTFPVSNEVKPIEKTKQHTDTKYGTITSGSQADAGTGSINIDVNVGDGSNIDITPKPKTITPSLSTKSPNASTTVSTETDPTRAFALRRLQEDNGTVPTKPPTSVTFTSVTTEPPAPTKPYSSSNTSTSPVVTGEFTCDTTFYSTWKQLNLKCGKMDLDIQLAIQNAKCTIYGGNQDITNVQMCMSVCKFPKCANGTWDYVAEDGFTSDIYQGLDFIKFMSVAGMNLSTTAQPPSLFSSLQFKTNRQCAYTGANSFQECQCESIPRQNNDTTQSAPAALRPLVDKGLGDANHWGDGAPKAAIDKVGLGAAAMGGSAAALSVAVSGVMTVAGGAMGTGAGVVSAGASMTLAMATVDFCQFGVMVNQMNLDATPRVLQELGKRMSPSAFSFLPFGHARQEEEEKETTESSRRRLEGEEKAKDGMTRYAQLIGVQVDMLFYLTLAGILLLCVIPFILFGIILLISMPFVSDLQTFASKWFDKAVGVLMMVLILSEYVIGVTATFQIYHSLTVSGTIDVGAGLAIFALLVVAVGTICWGYYVVHNYEDDLRDLGTKSHFDKSVHARYGPLYDEYKFESRFFFAPKLMLALCCGVTTGLSCIPGIWQVIILISIHILFLIYLEVKQPYPTSFVQKSSSFVIIIKISALFLTLFLLSTTSGIQKEIPVDLRQGVGFAIIGLQVLVLIALLIRQIYIFYRTWKLKQTKNEVEMHTQKNSFVPLGGYLHPMEDYHSRPSERPSEWKQPPLLQDKEEYKKHISPARYTRPDYEVDL